MKGIPCFFQPQSLPGRLRRREGREGPSLLLASPHCSLLQPGLRSNTSARLRFSATSDAATGWNAAVLGTMRTHPTDHIALASETELVERKRRHANAQERILEEKKSDV